ncbi:MAG: hypothetical protein KA116_02550 [Proteobacteria bacterium]|nr:hypothetical protein [Pseudomonadota bacterium]
MKLKTNYYGFTIVEVVMSVGIGAIALVLLATIINNGMKSLNKIEVSQDRDEALRLARLVLLQPGQCRCNFKELVLSDTAPTPVSAISLFANTQTCANPTVILKIGQKVGQATKNISSMELRKMANFGIKSTLAELNVLISGESNPDTVLFGVDYGPSGMKIARCYLDHPATVSRICNTFVSSTVNSSTCQTGCTPFVTSDAGGLKSGICLEAATF